LEKKAMKLSPSAMPSTCGPITMPSSSSITTTGGARFRGTTVTSVAAIAATATIAKKDGSSTSINAWSRTAGTRDATMARGPC
jgi:small neutral amino acid transporter SnatA (MarC family)